MIKSEILFRNYDSIPFEEMTFTCFLIRAIDSLFSLLERTKIRMENNCALGLKTASVTAINCPLTLGGKVDSFLPLEEEEEPLLYNYYYYYYYTK